MEELLKDIRGLLICVIVLLLGIVICQAFLVTERVRPPGAEAKSEEITKVNIVKIGGYYISKWEFLGGGK